MNAANKAVWGAAGALLLALAIVPAARADNGGEALFKQKCAGCHGADGKGQSSMGKTLKVRDLSSDEVQKQSDADLTAITNNGKNKMPAYKGKLTDDQIKDLVAYIRTLKK